LDFFITYFLIAIGLFVFVAVFTLFGVYAERKLSAFIQDRLGPTEVGKYGLLQTVADILKLIQKEIIVPAAADKVLFLMAPLIIFVAVYLGFAALPWAPGLIPAKINIGLYYILAIISIETLGILMAGWGSNNKYSILGAMRSAAQIISYEIPAGFALIAVVMIAQSLDLQTIALQQGVLSLEKTKFLGLWDVSATGGLLSWNIFRAPHLIVAFVIYFIASLAESNRAPFDIPEAESELVAGFHTEFTALQFALVFLAVRVAGGRDRASSTIYGMAAAMTNTGFVALPILHSIYGQPAVLPAAIATVFVAAVMFPAHWPTSARPARFSTTSRLSPWPPAFSARGTTSFP